MDSRYEMFNALGDDYGLLAAYEDRWIMDMRPRADGSQFTGEPPPGGAVGGARSRPTAIRGCGS